MIVKTFKGTIQILAGLSAGLAIILLLLVWQLSKGPISLGFLSPYIENAVNEDQSNFRLKMRDTILTWAGWERSFDIRVLDVQILNNKSEIISNIPELSFSLNRTALLKGEVAPNSVEIFGPTLRFIRQTSGSLNIGIGGSKEVYATSALDIVQEILDGPAGNHPLRYLTSLHILGADLTVDDQILEKSWMAPAADIRLTRDDIGVHGRLSIILDVEGKQTELELLARYKKADKQLEITADIDKLSLAPFAPVFGDVELLKNFDVPLKGNVGLSIPLSGGEQSVRFDITGDAGALSLPPPYSEIINIRSVAMRGGYSSASGDLEIEHIKVELAENQLRLPEPVAQLVNLKSGLLEGSYSSKTGLAVVQEFSGQLGANWNVYVPAPINHKMPLRSFSIKGQYDTIKDYAKISKFEADLQGPKVRISGDFTGMKDLSSPTRIVAELEIKDVPVNDVSRYWPKSIGTDSYVWITQHLSDGTLHQLNANTDIEVQKDGALSVKAMKGTMQLTGVTVDYLPPMPKAVKVGGDIAFDAKTFAITLTQGKTKSLALNTGKIRLTGLDVVDQYADIELSLNGSAQSKLAFIDAEPLGFASELGIDPSTASGQAQTDLKLKFILEHSLTFEQVQIDAQSRLTDFGLTKVILGRGIKNSSLVLKVNNKGMVVTGDVTFDSIDADLVWRENFHDNRSFRSQYDLNTTIKDVRQLRDFGAEMQPLADDYLNGPIGANIRYTVFDDVDRRLEVIADISDAEMKAPAFGWSKKAGVPGRSEITIDLERDVVVDIPRFAVKAADLNIKGAVRYAQDGTGMSEIRFDQLAFGRTDVKGALIPRDDGGWEVGLHGPSFDFSAYWEELFSGEPGAQGKQSLLPNLTMAIEIDQVWVNQTLSMKNVSGTFSYADEIWRTFLLSSELDGDASFDLSIQSHEDGNRRLTLRSNNAGDTLRFLDAYDAMQGGSLTMTGIYDDKVEGHPLKGQLTVNDYRIVDAPALAHILSIMALTGILDALSGDGIGFNSLEVPFIYHDGVVQITEARANGTSLGFTAGGRIYRHADVVDIKGTVVPAYALNSALGHIPVLGALLTGGDKGAGVFAANYSMSGSLQEPNVTVNPLSALTPGFLRNVFGVFENADDKPEFKPGDNLKIIRP